MDPNIGAYIDIESKLNLGAKHKCMDIDLGAWRQGNTSGKSEQL